jgi:hypothetical protein
MKDGEKDGKIGTEPAPEPTEEATQLNRGTFLKALGVGIGALGLDVVTGGHLAARAAADLEGSRSAVQKLVRRLLEEPSKAKDFVDNPQAVAKEFGISLTDADAMKIQETLKELANQVAAAVEGGHQDWSHQDGNWNDWYDKKVEKQLPKGPTQTKPQQPPTRRK